jgi:hypothetical protein
MGVDGGQEGLFLNALKPVIPQVFTDDGTVFCSMKQLSFFLWSRLRVKGTYSLVHQISVAVLINSKPLSRSNLVADGTPGRGRGRRL